MERGKEGGKEGEGRLGEMEDGNWELQGVYRSTTFPLTPPLLVLRKPV